MDLRCRIEGLKHSSTTHFSLSKTDRAKSVHEREQRLGTVFGWTPVIASRAKPISPTTHGVRKLKQSENARALPHAQVHLWLFAFVLIACGGSPRGLRVVFDSPQKLDGTDALNRNDPYNAYGTYNIWRVNADGTGLTPLTNATATDANSSQPQWSPDSSKILFNSSRKLDGTNASNGNSNPTYNIWRVNADGTGLTPLTNATAARAGSAAPQWSPDGTKVVFVSGRNLDGTDAPNPNFTYNIWRANADGTGLTPLTNLTAAQADSGGPQWSPDGSKLVFHSSRKLDGTDASSANFTFNIWLMSANGTGLTPLTRATANGVNSEWASFSR